LHLPAARAFQSFFQAVQLLLEPTEFGLLHPQSLFGIGYRCLDFSLLIRVPIELTFIWLRYLRVLFPLPESHFAFLLLDLFDRGRTDVLLSANLSEP